MLLFLSDMELEQIAENLYEHDYDIGKTVQHLGLDIDPYRAMRLFFEAIPKFRSLWEWLDYYPVDDLELQVSGRWYNNSASDALWTVGYMNRREHDAIN